MAAFDYTTRNIFSEYLFANEFTPRYDICFIKGCRKSHGNLDGKHRRFAPPHRSSGPGILGFSTNQLLLSMPENSAGKHFYYRHTTTAQFSGTVFPAGIRTIKLCRMSGNRAEQITVLQESATNSSGNFEFLGWYPEDEDLKYFYLITGDDGRESNDFLLAKPVRHEYQHGRDPQGNGINPYDTALDHRVLYVHDKFNGVQGSSLSVHTPDIDVGGGGWLTSVGDVFTGVHTTPGLGNFIAYTNGVAYQYGHIETSDADVLIHAKLVLGETALSDVGHGILLRYTDLSNFLYLSISDAGQSTMWLKLVSRLAGVESDLKIRQLPLAETRNINQYYQVKLLAKGNKIFYEINLGGKIWSDYVYNVDAHVGATRHGILVGGAEMYVDDFKIWSV